MKSSVKVPEIGLEYEYHLAVRLTFSNQILTLKECPDLLSLFGTILPGLGFYHMKPNRIVKQKGEIDFCNFGVEGVFKIGQCVVHGQYKATEGLVNVLKRCYVIL